jgi:hypothetical protein
LCDLNCELPRRRQDEGAGDVPARSPAGSGEALEDGQGERGGLARARLGAAQEVPACEEGWNRLLLDLSGSEVILGPDSAVERFDQAKVGKGTGSYCGSP